MLMDIAEIKRLIDEGKIEYVKIGASDIEGVFRGKRVAAKYFLNALDDGFPQCDVLFGWDIAENVLPNLKVSNWERGFADIVMKPDLSTFAMVPWEEKIASCIAASELEFRFFRESMFSLREKDFGPNLTPLNPGLNCYAISQASADDQVLGRIASMMRDHGVEMEGYNREHGRACTR